MSQKNITLKELSKILGVSISTISKALNDSHEISEATKNKVKELAELHNYQPNLVALNLKSGKTKTIAVVIPSIQNFFFANVLLGIESVVANSSYNIVVSITNESFQKEVDVIKTLSNGIVDGFIIATAEETQIKQSFNHFKLALEYEKPIVMFDRVVKSVACNKVIVNDFEAVYNATNSLIINGRKTIALVSTINNLSVGKSRTEGYKKSLLEAFLNVDDLLIIEGTSENISSKIKGLLTKYKIDAIVALDEDASLSSLKVSKKLGLQIPKQIAIVGYASEKMASNLSPELTSINQHGIKIGKVSAKMLIDKLDSNSKEIERIIIKSSLIKRGTS